MKWISVKERLPEYAFNIMGHEAVNILMTDGYMVIEGDYTNGKFNIFGIEHNNITHWMPLPDPPEEDA